MVEKHYSINVYSAHPELPEVTRKAATEVLEEMAAQDNLYVWGIVTTPVKEGFAVMTATCEDVPPVTTDG